MSKWFDIALMKTRKETGEGGVTWLLPDGGVMV